MPKEYIDYSNTIVYTIKCKNRCIKDVYVGYTTNFVKRKSHHKQQYKFSNKLDIYNVIRNNGGWENWEMIKLAEYKCKNSQEAKLKELYHYNKIMEQFKNGDEEEDDEVLTCSKCEFTCNKMAKFKKHLTTQKHKILHSEIEEPVFVCLCGNVFNHKSSFTNHKKNCLKENDTVTKSESTTSHISLVNELIEQNKILSNEANSLKTMMLEQNKDFKDIMLNVCKQMVPINHSSIVNNNINSNNKTFNLNFFLNEQCKDAMNITDFVDSLKLQLSDLENVGKQGFVQGISNIIIKNLNALDIYKRPVHCSDSKREIMYVKDEDKWEKENNEKIKLKKAIRKIAHQNSKLLVEFKKMHPDCNDSESKLSDYYNKLIIEAMGGLGNNTVEKEEKIIKNISRSVTIDKTVAIDA